MIKTTARHVQTPVQIAPFSPIHQLCSFSQCPDYFFSIAREEFKFLTLSAGGDKVNKYSNARKIKPKLNSAKKWKL
jgi:hypothetical protein